MGLWSSSHAPGLVNVAGQDHNTLANLATGDVHTQYALLAGRSGGQSLYGSSVINEDMNIFASSVSGGSIRLKSHVIVDNTAGMIFVGNANIGTGGGTNNPNNLYFAASVTGPAIYGSVASGGDLLIGSTSNATKGNINFGTSTYDEVNNRLGVGTINPQEDLHVMGGIRLEKTPNATYSAYGNKIDDAGFQDFAAFNAYNNGVFKASIAFLRDQNDTNRSGVRLLSHDGSNFHLLHWDSDGDLYWDVDGDGDIGKAADKRPNNIWAKSTLGVGTSAANAVGNTVEIAGGKLDMGSNKITSVTDPTLAQDAATKNYVDTTDATANGIRTATTVVAVSASTAPTSGQVLTASSTTLAAWATPSSASSSGGITAIQLSDGASGFAQDTSLRFITANDTLEIGISNGNAITFKGAGDLIIRAQQDNITKLPLRIQATSLRPVDSNTHLGLINAPWGRLWCAQVSVINGENIIFAVDAGGNIGESAGQRPSNVFVKNSVDLDNGGLVLNAIEDTFIITERVGAPTTPGAGKFTMYAKSDGFYQIDDAGVETSLSGVATQDTETQAASTTHTINFNDGKSTVWDLQAATGNITLTLSNPIAGSRYIIKIIQGSTARTVTWPSTVKWPGGTAPVISTTDNDIDVIHLYFDGTNYLGTFDQAFA